MEICKDFLDCLTYQDSRSSFVFSCFRRGVGNYSFSICAYNKNLQLTIAHCKCLVLTLQ